MERTPYDRLGLLLAHSCNPGNSESTFGFPSTVGFLGGNMRKVTQITMLLVLGPAVAGCGSSSFSGLINGTWTATLTNADGSITYQFSATFAQATGSNLNITNLTFTTAGACDFAVAGGAGGSFSPSSRAFAMSMVELNVGGDILALQGTLSNGTISGTWSASGLVPSCSGNGTFTIQPSMAG
jgi:hypothetical protein